MTKAVDRYKDLAEGNLCGREVDRTQIIEGIPFYYNPPPRGIVAYAAGLRADGSTMEDFFFFDHFGC